MPVVPHLPVLLLDGAYRRVREILTETPGLHLVASGYDGVGIPDCIRQGEAAARVITA